ncbi:hypothetical protein QYE76_020272 [Lolium multiflorum]|uniref:Uncharacterized protein n=1 Tax=Lolium multiflorum TaxID=4521 RepID=A0AAD8R601_LOLMU|nr:hypothetical protein QYE76_020272 [Lolium multiflorum]
MAPAISVSRADFARLFMNQALVSSSTLLKSASMILVSSARILAGVHPPSLGVKQFGLGVCLLDLNYLFGEVVVDGSCGLFFQTPLLVPSSQGGTIVGHHLLHAHGERKGLRLPL